MSTALLAISLDPDAAGHLALALKVHRHQLDRRGLVSPPGLLDLEHAAAEMRIDSHGQPSTTNRRPSHDTQSDDGISRAWLSPREAAREIGVSESTIRRRIKTGELPSVSRGRIRRINRHDLDQFMRSSEKKDAP